MRRSILIAVFAIVTALGVSPARAALLSFSFTDPEGDAFLFPGEVGPATDVAGLFFTFDNTTGDYEITMTAFPSHPFVGDVIISVNLFNPDTGATTTFPAFFSDTLNTFFLNTPSIFITLAGSDPRLLDWEAGDRVAACEGSGGIIPEACSGGLGHPSDGPIEFQSGVINFDPNAPSAESNIARDSFQNLPPATIVVMRMRVVIDIKPGSDPNAVNPRSKGVIPIAVLGSVDFDAGQVDPATVAFGPNSAPAAHNGHVDDVNDDGFPDMVFHFRSRDTGIVCGDTDATLTGEIFAGAPFTGTDAVKTAGCK